MSSPHAPQPTRISTGHPPTDIPHNSAELTTVTPATQKIGADYRASDAPGGASRRLMHY